MKKLLLLISASITLIFASCTVNGAGASGDFSFTLDEAFLEKIYNARSVLSDEDSDKGELTLEFSVTGSVLEKRTVEYQDRTAAENDEITFEQLPLNKAITVSVCCYIDDELLYEAASDSFMFNSTDNPYELSSLVKKLTDTPYALYNRNGVYLYRNLNDSKDFISTDLLKSALLEKDSSIIESSFKVVDTCFDAEGDCIAAITVENSAATKSVYIGNINSGIIYSTSLENVFSITFAAENNSVLLRGTQKVSDSESEEVLDFIYTVADKKAEKIYSLKELGLSELSINLMVYNNKKLYIVHSSTDENNCVYKLSKYAANIVIDNEELVDFSVKAENEINLRSVNLSKIKLRESALYSDILAQNDRIYILYSGSNSTSDKDTNSSMASYGALFEYDEKTLSLQRSIDLNPSSVTYSNFKTYAFVNNQKIYVDNKLQTPYLKTFNDEFTYYGPAEVSGAELFGSERFVARKPRKIVFADNGFIFTTSPTGVLSCKNVNRIVTVDLESFEVSYVSAAPSGINFGFDINDNIKLESGSVSDLLEDGLKLYIESNGKSVELDSSKGLIYSTAIEVLSVK